jgi:hypothetical protein
MEHADARNEDFNLSTAESTTVFGLAGMIWRKIKTYGPPGRTIQDGNLMALVWNANLLAGLR